MAEHHISRSFPASFLIIIINFAKKKINIISRKIWNILHFRSIKNFWNILNGSKNESKTLWLQINAQSHNRTLDTRLSTLKSFVFEPGVNQQNIFIYSWICTCVYCIEFPAFQVDSNLFCKISFETILI